MDKAETTSDKSKAGESFVVEILSNDGKNKTTGYTSGRTISGVIPYKKKD